MSEQHRRSEQSLTDWSMVLDAGSLDSPSRSASLDRLVRRYWPSLFACVRAGGCSAEEANDIVQGFVADVILERNLPAHADRDRGRFRGLLFRSIGNYVRDYHRRHRSLKRHPKHRKVASLDVEGSPTPSDQSTDDPEQAFTRHWVATILRRAIETVRTSFIDRDREVEWEILEARLVLPMINGVPPVPYASLVERFELRDVPQAASFLVNGKRALGHAILAEIGETVDSPDQINAEAQDLLRLLTENTR